MLLFRSKKNKKGVEMAEVGLVLAFVSVVAITVYYTGGQQVRDFFYSFINLQEDIKNKSLKCSQSTDPDCL